jgi:antitoxin component YwqK of YwqJK toxin-antitoxin module
MPSINFFLFVFIGIVMFHEHNGVSEPGMLINERTVAEVNKSELILDAAKGLVFDKNQPFSGISKLYYKNGQLAEKISYREGKKDGVLQKWFVNGMLSYEANYKSNKRHGRVTSWWQNGNKRTIGNFVESKANGPQKQWYSSGALFKQQNMRNGVEEGIQQAWRENGKLYINYEAKNGRFFGLKRSNLCYQLKDETVQFKK